MDFAAGPLSGSASPNAKLGDGGYLLDRAGDGMTAILFCDGAPNTEQAALLAQLGQFDRRFVALPVAAKVRRQQQERLPMPTAKSPACSPRSRAPSICCVPTCTSPDAGRTSFPAKSCEPPAFAWGEPLHDRDAIRRFRIRLRVAGDGDRFGRPRAGSLVPDPARTACSAMNSATSPLQESDRHGARRCCGSSGFSCKRQDSPVHDNLFRTAVANLAAHHMMTIM